MGSWKLVDVEKVVQGRVKGGAIVRSRGTGRLGKRVWERRERESGGVWTRCYRRELEGFLGGCGVGGVEPAGRQRSCFRGRGLGGTWKEKRSGAEKRGRGEGYYQLS